MRGDPPCEDGSGRVRGESVCDVGSDAFDECAVEHGEVVDASQVSLDAQPHEAKHRDGGWPCGESRAFREGQSE